MPAVLQQKLKLLQKLKKHDIFKNLKKVLDKPIIIIYNQHAVSATADFMAA